MDISFAVLSLLALTNCVRGWSGPHSRPSPVRASFSLAAGADADADADTMPTKLKLLVGNLGKIGTACELVLASQSPRRKEILTMMGLARFDQIPSPLDEGALQVELAARPITPREYARTLAERKALELCQSLAGGEGGGCGGASSLPRLVLGSDTIVDLDGAILEKPEDRSDAAAMLRRLSGNWHMVHTGVALYLIRGGEVTLATSFTDTANVKFAPLDEEDIVAYVETGEPDDKAGSYGIQGIGGQLVERMEGDFFTVMGLPMHRVSKALADAVADL